MKTKEKNGKKVAKAAPITAKKKVAKKGPAIGERKDLTYKYPAEAVTLEARKKFRTSVRAKMKTLRKNWKAIEGKKKEGNVEEAKHAYFAFKKKNVAKADIVEKGK